MYSTTLHDRLHCRDKPDKTNLAQSVTTIGFLEPGVREDGYLSAFSVRPGRNCGVNRRLRTHPAEAWPWWSETIP